jgi:signal transduction histidine kinase
MMSIVTMMLIVIFGLVLNLTSRRLRDENIRMMSSDDLRTGARTETG